MINGLIEVFERLKNFKQDKFGHSRVGIIDTPEKLEAIKKALLDYEDNVLALLDIEEYINTNDSKRREPNYLGMLMSFLLYYKNEKVKMDDLTEQKIRNDEHVIEALVNLEERVANGVESQITYAPVLKEINDIDTIINCLKGIEQDDYLEPDIIKMIYDYLMTETHISYQEKYINIGKMIAKHNINVNKKRTRI